jgi:4-hydroxy-tetrahydrodipicolinate synthase
MYFGKVLTAMVTPYTHEGEVDYPKVQKLTRHLLANGSDGVLICGTTGESPCLTPAERANLWAAAKEAVGDDGYLILGTTDNETAFSRDVAKKAAAAGADALLAVCPYYNKPSQEGLYRHFATIAASADIPIILYNIPGRTGVNILPETVLRLAKDCPNIVAIKDATGSLDSVSSLKTILPPDFAVYSGDDSLTLPIVSVGGAGVISVASHLIGKEIAAMIEAYQQGDVAKALALHLQYFEVFKKLFITTNPVPVKACLNLQGWDMGDCRLPLAPPSDSELETLRDMLQRYNLL